MLTNIHVSNVSRFEDYYQGERITLETKTRGVRVAIKWESENCRFHFWYWPETDYLEDDTIYKNPPPNTSRNDGAYFATRRLDARAKKNAEIVREVLRVARAGMIEAAISAARFDQAYVEAEQENHYRDSMARAATLLRFAPLRVGRENEPCGSRSIYAHNGRLIADTDTPELAALFVYLTNQEAARHAELDDDFARSYAGSAVNV